MVENGGEKAARGGGGASAPASRMPRYLPRHECPRVGRQGSARRTHGLQEVMALTVTEEENGQKTPRAQGERW